MVIGIQCPGKGTAGGSRGVSAPSARPFRPNSKRLLRRRSLFLRRIGRSGSGVRRRGSGIRRSSSGVRRSSGVGRGGSARVGRSGGVGRGRGRLSSGLFLLGTTGAQHEGNRNGAPDLCIHRQLPQYVSEKKMHFRGENGSMIHLAISTRRGILPVLGTFAKVAILRQLRPPVRLSTSHSRSSRWLSSRWASCTPTTWTRSDRGPTRLWLRAVTTH